jgi:hypothetical protein
MNGKGARVSKQFVKISKNFGFNRNRLLYWEFDEAGEGSGVILCFEGSNDQVTLQGDEAQTFRNWTENEAEAAPETYQYTLFQRPQDTQGQKQNSTQQEAE